MSEQSVRTLLKRPQIGSWYAKVLTGLAVANEQSVTAAQRDEHLSLYDTERQFPADSISQVDNFQLSLPPEIYTSLDPFLSLPASITPYQRSRFQVGLSYVNFWFGATSNPRYSGTFSIGLATVIHSTVGRQWICIHAEQTLRVLEGETQPNQDLIHQKRKGWYDLNEALRSRDTRFEEVILAMSIVGVERLIYGTTAAMNLHATTMDMLLRSRGSMQAALKATPHTEPYFIMGQFAVGKCHFPDGRRLEIVKQRWQFCLTRILHEARPEYPVIKAPRTDEDSSDSKQQLQARVINLVIGVGRTCKSVKLASSFQLVMLLELASTLLEFAQTPELMRLYFKQMDFLTTGLLIGGGSGQATNDNRNVPVAEALSRARRDVLKKWSPNDLLAFDADICEVVIDALKIFQYLDIEGRELVLGKLSAWLVTNPLEGKHLQLTEAELCALDDQIVQNWKMTMEDPNSW